MKKKPEAERDEKGEGEGSRTAEGKLQGCQVVKFIGGKIAPRLNSPYDLKNPQKNVKSGGIPIYSTISKLKKISER